MRKLYDHIVPGDSANHQLTITVEDEPGAGGACHRYLITGFNTSTNVSFDDSIPYTEDVILFQNGPIKDVGVNGITHESLLAILIDRLACFQAGPYECTDNESALKHLNSALSLLQERTKKRIERGVEGTHTK